MRSIRAWASYSGAEGGGRAHPERVNRRGQRVAMDGKVPQEQSCASRGPRCGESRGVDRREQDGRESSGGNEDEGTIPRDDGHYNRR